MEQLQLFTGQEAMTQHTGPVGFVYRMPGKSIQWMVEAAVMAHIRRWGHPPALIRVSKAHAEDARHNLDVLNFPHVAVIPNGGTLACEVETWEGQA
jgi:hypothetical protein